MFTPDCYPWFCAGQRAIAGRRVTAAVCVVAILVMTPVSSAQVQVQVNVQADVQIQTRGPVHEAFAEPVLYEPAPTFTVQQPPPEPIEEFPPDERPEGEDIGWIPGYWGWDEERSDYLWISGVWRQMPPNRQFFPGYWAQTVEGYRWVPGFWYTSTQRQIEYLPQPPELYDDYPEEGPPSADATWVPGIWLWQENRYVWRPGYWLPPQQEWVWVPARYIWTPRGYLFVGGYWDYNVRERGLLFAPVYVPRQVYTRPQFVYRPAVVINVDVLAEQWFVRPRYHHYYFGDYYDRRYYQQGIYPGITFHNSRYGYDPIYVSNAAYYRGRLPQWEDRLREAYRYRRMHPDARPPRTYNALQTMIGNRNIGNINSNNITIVNNTNIVNYVQSQNALLARPLDQIGRDQHSRFRLRPIEQDRRGELRQRVQATRGFMDTRRRLEMAGADRVRADREDARRREPVRLDLPRSPLAGRSVRTAVGNARPMTDDPREIERRPLGVDGRQADRERAVERQPATPDRRVTPQQRPVAPEPQDRVTERERRPVTVDRQTATPVRPGQEDPRANLRERTATPGTPDARSAAGQPRRSLVPPPRPRVPKTLTEVRNQRPIRNRPEPRDLDDDDRTTGSNRVQSMERQPGGNPGAGRPAAGTENRRPAGRDTDGRDDRRNRPNNDTRNRSDNSPSNRSENNARRSEGDRGEARREAAERREEARQERSENREQRRDRD